MPARSRPRDSSSAASNPLISSNSAASTCSASWVETSFWNLRLSARIVCEPLPGGQDVDPLVVEQGLERGAGQATGRLEEGFERERDVPRLLRLGPIDQPDGRLLEDQADRDPGLVEQPLELLLRRLDPGAVLRVGRLAVEVDPAGDRQPEQGVRRAVLGGLRPAIGEARFERVVVLGELRGGAPRGLRGGRPAWGPFPGRRTSGRSDPGDTNPAGPASSRGSRSGRRGGRGGCGSSPRRRGLRPRGRPSRRSGRAGRSGPRATGAANRPGRRGGRWARRPGRARPA